jgi:hypothetical protein
MPVTIISADQRLAQRAQQANSNVIIFGPPGVGKTFQLRLLDPSTTLALNLEAGMLSVDGDVTINGPLGATVLQPYMGDTINVKEEAAKLGVHPWEYCRALACLLAGPDPAAPAGSPYHQTAYENYAAAIAPPEAFAKYATVFTDSITVASRWTMSWAKQQPRAFSEKTGKQDMLGAYGLLGEELITWLTTLQQTPGRSMVVVGILEVVKDDFGRTILQPQIEGSKAARELPGIFDQVVTLATFTVDAQGVGTLDLDKGTHRGFVCHKNNPYGVPAKDRSGRLDLIEPPDLGALLRKIAGPARADVAVTTFPASNVAQ